MTVSQEPRAPDSSPPQESSVTPSPRPRPSLFDIVFVIWALVIPVGFGYRLLNSDGDLARHLRIGEVMLERGAMLREYPFAHTVTGRPFLAFEWGSEVVYAAVHRAAGLAGIAIFAGLLLALTYALLVRFLIRQGGDPLLAYVVSMAAAVLSAAHWLARPHLFTMFFVVVLLGLLERRGRRTLWLFVPLFIVWANLHGGFFYGCILIGLYAVGELLEGLVSGDRAVWFARARHHGVALGLALAASLVNPHGFALLAHVGGFFGNSAILQQTQEFMSPNFHTVNGKLFLLALLGILAALAFSRRRPTVPVLLVLMANLAFSLISQRNIEFFALVALPLVALHLDAEWRALPLLRRVKETFQREHAGELRRPEQRRGERAADRAGLVWRHRCGTGGGAESVRQEGVSGGGGRARQGGTARGPTLQSLHLGRVPAVRLARAAGVHRRRHGLLRRGGLQGVPHGLVSRSWLGRGTPEAGHLTDARAAAVPPRPRAGSRPPVVGLVLRLDCCHPPAPHHGLQGPEDGELGRLGAGALRYRADGRAVSAPPTERFGGWRRSGRRRRSIGAALRRVGAAPGACRFVLPRRVCR